MMAGKKVAPAHAWEQRLAMLERLASRARHRPKVSWNRFSFTDDQRAAIAAVLRQTEEQSGESSDVVDRIEIWVRETAHTLAKETISPDHRRRLNKLVNPIEKILNVLEHKESAAMSDAYPDAVPMLKSMQGSINKGKKKPKLGRGFDPDVTLIADLVRELSRLWLEHIGPLPKAWYDKVTQQDEDKFSRFVRLCLAPAGIEASTHAIRKGRASIGDK